MKIKFEITSNYTNKIIIDAVNIKGNVYFQLVTVIEWYWRRYKVHNIIDLYTYLRVTLQIIIIIKFLGSLYSMRLFLILKYTYIHIRKSLCGANIFYKVDYSIIIMLCCLLVSDKQMWLKSLNLTHKL